MEPFQGTVEQVEFPAQCREAPLRQALEEVVDHCAEATCDLEVFRAVLAYLAEGELDEILPVRGLGRLP